ncbi:MAG: TolC family protein [Planctomycetota bacterium]|nr:TolC family protein [Planctomycetota bacterium]
MDRRFLFALGIAALGIGFAGCNLAPPEMFDPAALQKNERYGAANSSSDYLRPLPTTREGAYGEREHGPSLMPAPDGPNRPTTGPDLDSDPVVRMSLREIIHRAVANNHDVKVAGYQPAIEGTRVIEVEGNFDPVFFTTVQYQHKDDVTGGQIFNSFGPNGGLITTDIDKQDLGTLQTGIQQNLDNGGQVQLQYQNLYSWFSPQRTTLNPFYESDLTVQLTQPLLRNFGSDVSHARIVINRLNQKVSLLEFRKAVEQNATDIEKAYWNLVQAQRDVQILSELVARTESTYDILNTRMRQKLDVSQLQVSQTQTRLESRRAQLLQFKSQVRDFSDQIKGLMSDPEFPVTSSIVILPADAPVEEPMEFNLGDQINTAMENRFELGEQQLKVDAADVTVTVAKNNLLPQLDFIGSVGAVGGAGNYGDAIKKNSDFNHFDYTVGFKLQIPLGNRAARAIWKRTLLERMAAIEQYRSHIETISVDVKTSARGVSTSWDTIVETRRALYAAEDALGAINERERSGEPLTPEFVQLKLDIQEQLSQALQAEAQAVAGYNIALAQLERSKGTLLRYNNVLLEEEMLKAEDNGLLH